MTTEKKKKKKKRKTEEGIIYEWLPEDSPAKIAYKEVTEKPTKKTKGGQKLTWDQVITRDLNTIDIDLQKAIKLSKDRDL